MKELFLSQYRRSSRHRYQAKELRSYVTFSLNTAEAVDIGTLLSLLNVNPIESQYRRSSRHRYQSDFQLPF